MIQIYTDGSCKKNPGPGGYAAIIIFDDKTEKIIKGADKNTTNNRMEMNAVICGLKYVESNKISEPIQIITDSQYVIKGITDYIKKWQQNNWKTAANKPVKNQDLWIEMNHLIENLAPNLQFKWVKGHSGNKMNDKVDQIAQLEAAKAQNS